MTAFPGIRRSLAALVLAAVPAALLASAQEARAGFISSAADPALSGARLIDFEGLAHGETASLTTDGVTFAAEAGALKIHSASHGGLYGGSGTQISTVSLDPPYAFSISFSAPVDAFGMVWGAANPDWSLTAYDARGDVLDSVTLPGGDRPDVSFVEFYGLAAPGIARVALRSLGGYDWVKIDDVLYSPSAGAAPGLAPGAVPLPGAAPLLALALGGLAALRRRPRA